MDFVWITLPIAFAIALVAAMVLLEMAPRWGLVDLPGGRKKHKHHTPLIGGLILWAGLLSLLFVVEDLLSLLPLLVLTGATIAVGVLDDRHELSAYFRLAVHLLVGLGLACWVGVKLESLGALFSSSPIVLGWAAVPVTMFAVAAAKNALNMVDGVDGLAGVLSGLPVVVVLYFAVPAGHPVLVPFALALTGGLLVFLCLNFPFPWRAQAACFLGDTGSTLLGLMVAWLLLQGAQDQLFRPVLALYLVAVPLIDTAGVMLRRVLRGVSMSTPGRDHLHHVFIDAGMPPRHATYLIVSIAVLLACIGMIMEYRAVSESVMFLVFLCLLALKLTALRSSDNAKRLIRERFYSQDE